MIWIFVCIIEMVTIMMPFPRNIDLKHIIEDIEKIGEHLVSLIKVSRQEQEPLTDALKKLKEARAVLKDVLS